MATPTDPAVLLEAIGTLRTDLATVGGRLDGKIEGVGSAIAAHRAAAEREHRDLRDDIDRNRQAIRRHREDIDALRAFQNRLIGIGLVMSLLAGSIAAIIVRSLPG